jgi:hypothetical protein
MCYHEEDLQMGRVAMKKMGQAPPSYRLLVKQLKPGPRA